MQFRGCILSIVQKMERLLNNTKKHGKNRQVLPPNLCSWEIELRSINPRPFLATSPKSHPSPYLFQLQRRKF